MPFQFKYFHLNQERCAMKVGTDGMLLGAFANPIGNTILDIGTGTGVLALMMAQKSEAEILAIEIDKEAAEQAVDNFAASPWADRLTCIHTSLQDFTAETETRFDFIICNPPFFEARNMEKGGNLQQSSKERATARSETNLSIEELLTCIRILLNKVGKFCLILPFSSLEVLRSGGEIHGLYIQKLIYIRSYENEEFIRFIAEMGFEDLPINESIFTIYEEPRKYSKEYIELTKEFHGVSLNS